MSNVTDDTDTDGIVIGIDIIARRLRIDERDICVVDDVTSIKDSNGAPPISPTEVSLMAVAVHELGHSLGLAHSDVEDGLMYPYYQYVTESNIHSSKLHYDDIIGIQRLYGTGGHPVPEPPPPTTAKPSTTTTLIPTTPYIPTTTRPGPPDVCHSPIDAITTIRQEIFIFKGGWFWRLDSNGTLNEKPVELRRFWFDLPENVTAIDAVYERKDTDQVVFFIGKEYYVFQGHRALPGYPRPLTELGLPSTLDRITLAFNWAYNGKTYLFADGIYWRFDPRFNHVELDYPRDIDLNWHELPPDRLDAAFTDHHGRTLFFSGLEVFHFRGTFMRVARGYPKDISSFWPYCRQPPSRSPNSEFLRSNSHTHVFSSSLSVLFTLFLPCLLNVVA